MARLESGEVLLTARMSDVFPRFRQTVLPWDVALAQFHAEGELVQAREARRLREREPAPPVVAAREFNLHVPLAFPWAQGKIGQHGFVEIERDAHAGSLAGALG